MSLFVDSRILLSSRLFSVFQRLGSKFPCITANKYYSGRKSLPKKTMEVLNVPPIVTAYRQALKTFDDSNSKDIDANLKRLKALVDNLKAEDLGFDKTLSNPEQWKKPNKAPCSYIEVFQNNVMNMSIFVLKPGFKMPLHDHPHMHGLLKVISGAVKMRSFSEYPLTDKDLAKFNLQLKENATKRAQGNLKRRKLFAKVQSNSICRANTATCVLTPSSSNYHEIEALEMPAAFFDILAPPYDTFLAGVGPRRCRYYEVIHEISTNIVQLQETDVPECFYCDQAPYLGPQLV